MSMIKKTIWSVILLAGAIGFAQAQGMIAVLDEGFSYTAWNSGTAPMSANWSLVNGGVPQVDAAGSVKLSDAVIGSRLGLVLNTDFQLSLEAAAGSGKRLWTGLFNDAGTQGYGVSWDADGKVSLRKFVVATVKELSATTAGTALGTESVSVPRGSKSILLSWNVDAHRLQLKVDGKVVSEATDAAFAGFSKVLVGGQADSISHLAVSLSGGAAVPFLTYEAEDARAKTTGRVVVMKGIPAGVELTPEMEASHRGYVALTETGQYWEVVSKQAANAMVIRHCIPDAEKGGGMEASLSLYVNGKKRQALVLSSLHNWNYIDPVTGKSSNDPATGAPKVFWDESRYFVEGGIKPGDIVRLQKDKDDTAAFYRIDVVDLEYVPGPLAPPAAGAYLSVVDYGAVGDGKTDCTEAVAKCIADAKAQGKIVWMPAGTYVQSERWLLDGVKVQGAGMWYTNLMGVVEGKMPVDWGGKVGFILSGTGTEVHDLYVDVPYNDIRQKGAKPFTTAGRPPEWVGAPSDWKVENVWIQHTNTGFWLSHAKNGTIRGCRIHCTYADAINLNAGSSDCLVENNHVRGNGDDGLAILSETLTKNVTTNITIRYNTALAIWVGHNCDLAGGSGHVIEYNDLEDNSMTGCFTLNFPGVYPMHPLTGSVFRRNYIARGGGNHGKQRRGAIWIFPGSTTIHNMTIQDNYIVDPVFRGIHITGTCEQEITFERNQIVNPGQDGVVVDAKALGCGVFTDNTVTKLKDGFSALKNTSPTYKITGSGNTWNQEGR